MKRSPFTKRKGPDGKTHEGWCAIFEGDCCSCDDDGRKDPDANELGAVEWRASREKAPRRSLSSAGHEVQEASERMRVPNGR